MISAGTAPSSDSAIFRLSLFVFESLIGDAAKEKLETAEAALAIAELPSADAVTSSDKTAIEAARAKYDALTDAQKSQGT